jgi:hypothetical protein
MVKKTSKMEIVKEQIEEILIILLIPICLIIFIFLISNVEAKPLSTYDIIKHESIKLNGSDINETIGNVMDYVGNNVSYKFYKYPRHIIDVWKTKEGDCTDQATLIKYMLEANKIKTIFVHGYCDGFKHDWLRYGKLDIDNFECSKRTYIGERVW